MAPDTIIEPLEAALLEMHIELGEAGKGRDRHQEVASHIADQALDLAFVVALAGPAEAVKEQIVRLQLGKGARPLARAITEDAAHRQLGVVVENRLGPTGLLAFVMPEAVRAPRAGTVGWREQKYQGAVGRLDGQLEIDMRREVRLGLSLGAAALGFTLATAHAQTALSDGDREFIEQAAQGGHAEVSMGQSAAESKNPAISAFGKQMVADHSKMNDELAMLAKRKGFEPPASADMAS